MKDNNFNQDGFSREQLSEKARRGEPLIEPAAIRSWAEANLPLRGPLRQEFAVRLAEQARERRTLESISSRIASQLTGPIENALRDVTTDRVQNNLERGLNPQDGIEGRARQSSQSDRFNRR